MAFAEIIEKSEVWHKEYNLPLIPTHLNPHFYNAVIWTLLRSIGEDVPQSWYKADYEYNAACRKENPDRFVIYPDFRGGEFSHDECIGRAATSHIGASEILSDLSKFDGVYPRKDGSYEWKRNFYRFIFLVPFLKHRAGYILNPFSRLMWCAHVMFSAIGSKSETFDPDGCLKIWVMGEHMKELIGCNWVYSFWKYRMKRINVGPKRIFTSHYLTECPVLGILAPEHF